MARPIMGHTSMTSDVTKRPNSENGADVSIMSQRRTARGCLCFTRGDVDTREDERPQDEQQQDRQHCGADQLEQCHGSSEDRLPGNSPKLLEDREKAEAL